MLSEEEQFTKQCSDAHQILKKVSFTLNPQRRTNSAEKLAQPPNDDDGNQGGLCLQPCPLKAEPDEVIPRLYQVPKGSANAGHGNCLEARPEVMTPKNGTRQPDKMLDENSPPKKPVMEPRRLPLFDASQFSENCNLPQMVAQQLHTSLKQIDA